MNALATPTRVLTCVVLSAAVVACGDDPPPAAGDTTTAETAVQDTTSPEPSVESTAATDTTAAETTTPATSAPATAPAESPVTESTVTEVPASSGAPASTTAPEPATTPAPPAPSRSDLVLRSNGVGAADFGQADIEVIPQVTALLGTPVDDRLGEYPNFDTDFNTYVDFEDTGFTAPFGRTTCYDNDFCLQFGGDTSDDLRFVGWTQRGFEPISAPLVTRDGVTIGSRYADHIGVMTVDEGGCFTQGSGEVAGVRLFVSSETVPFGSFDEAGNYVAQTPDPSDIVVTSLQAGDEPFYLFADC